MSNTKGQFPISMLYAVLKYFPVSFYFKDRNGYFVAVSKAKAANSNVTVEEMIGKTDFNFMSKEEATQSFIDDQWVIETGKSIEGKERKITRSNGIECWVSETKALWVEEIDGSEEAEIRGIMGISIDITERKIAEKGRNEAEQKLNESNAQLVKLLESAEHDVINKLMTITLAVRDLRKNRLEDVNVAYDRILKTNLEVERIISGYLSDPLLKDINIPQKEIFDVSTDIIEPIRAEYSQESDDNDIHIDNSLGGIPLNEIMVSKEERKILDIIFRNIIGNAMKYSGKGTKVAFGYELSEKHIRLNVFNTGSAIPKGDEEKIFSEGYSTGNSKGVGLPNCRELARLNGGDLIYETTEDGYPNFIIIWPKK